MAILIQMEKIVTLSAVMAAIAITSAAQAATTFTATVTANETGKGYTQGQSYNFTWSLNSQSTSVGTAGTNAVWRIYNTTADTAVFSDFSGSGLGGTFHVGNPSEQIGSMAGGKYLFINAPLGMTMLDGTAITSTVLFGTYNRDGFTGFTSLSTTQNAAAYYAGYTGTYTLSKTPERNYLELTLNGNVSFTPTSVTIADGSPPAVPEPAFFQMGALLGMSGLGCLKLRRKA